MAIEALFIGSIGVLAETSDIQRQSYNQALGEAGLSWRWSEDAYRELLGFSGGKDRLRMLSDATGAGLSDDEIAAIHARKTELAGARIREDGVALRPGIEPLIDFCLESDVALGLVTSTYQTNIDAIRDGVRGRLPLERFDVVVSRDDVERGKPDPEAYCVALERTGAPPAAILAIEDTPVSALAARRAGVEVIVHPGAFTNDQPFLAYERVFESLTDAAGGLSGELRRMIAA